MVDKSNNTGSDHWVCAERFKSWLVVKQQHEATAKEIFKGTNISITTKGKKHLGAAVGSDEYKKKHINALVNKWVKELVLLSQIAKSQPQSAYAAFTSGCCHKLNYYLRTLDGITHLLQPVEDVIRHHLIPALCEGRNCNDNERSLMSLPIKMGGLGLVNVVEEADIDFPSSREINQHLVNNIIGQIGSPPPGNKKLYGVIKKKKKQHYEKKLDQIKKYMSPDQMKALMISQLEGSSIWLSTLPTKSEKYTLNSQEFFDAIHTRYNWHPKHLPVSCACGANFSLQHTINCHLGGYIMSRHNHLRNRIFTILTQACDQVELQPSLLTIHPSQIRDFKASTIVADEARADISCLGFWKSQQRAFFDVKVTNLLAPSFQNQFPSTTFASTEKDKKRTPRDDTFASSRWRLQTNEVLVTADLSLHEND